MENYDPVPACFASHGRLLWSSTAYPKLGMLTSKHTSVDPGVDHLYAIKKIEEVHSKGGKVCSLVPSYRDIRQVNLTSYAIHQGQRVSLLLWRPASSYVWLISEPSESPSLAYCS